MSDVMLQAEHLWAGYGHRVVVEDFSCAFRPGEVTVLLGRNGCGKSTLLRALGGLLPALKGRVFLDGQDMAAYRPARRAQLLATLPQGRDVPDITARRLVLHGRFPYLAYPRRYGPAEQALAEAALARVGIPELADRPLKRLSGGQRQKVYLAMLLCQDSPVMLLSPPPTWTSAASWKPGSCAGIWRPRAARWWRCPTTLARACAMAIGCCWWSRDVCAWTQGRRRPRRPANWSGYSACASGPWTRIISSLPHK